MGLLPGALMLLASACSRPPDEHGNGHRVLQQVRERGYVRCGASKDTRGFSAPDSSGRWRGLDVDTCRAIAVAALGDAERVRLIPLTGQQRLTALQTGEIDVLPRTTTWTLRRDAGGINFTVPTYYDYVAFMVRRGVAARPADLRGAAVCVQTGSLSEVALVDVNRTLKLDLRPVVFDNVQGTRQAFLSGRCDALLTDASALLTLRAALTRNPADYIVFPADQDIAALTPAVRHGDDQWFDIVKFAIQAMIVAEHLRIDRGNLQRMRGSDDPVVRQFLGLEGDNGAALGIANDFAYQIVRQVGNYREVYDASLGHGSRLNVPRGLNHLQRDGGLMLPIGFH